MFATHTEPEFFLPGDRMKGMIELNAILGTQTVCCVRGLATAPGGVGYHATASGEPDGWKELTGVLQAAAETLRRHKMACSFHNHAVEFEAKDGVRPVDILAKSKDLVFHIDVNVCRRAGSDPVAFMRQYPEKTECLLLTDGPPDAGRGTPRCSERATRRGRTSSPPRRVSVGKVLSLTHGATGN